MTASAPYIRENEISPWIFSRLFSTPTKLDMAKRVGRFGSGQSGRGLSWVASQVELTRIFQTILFLFFETDAICQLFMSSLTMIRFLLVILLPITTKHLT